MKKPAYEIGSGNVFADIGSRNPEEKLLRAQLLMAIARIVKRRRLTQAEIAAKTGLKQPEVSRLINQVLDGFSADRLARILLSLGYDVRISLKRRQGPLPRSRAA
jgi:predicted XRE-type DNA-binding protein